MSRAPSSMRRILRSRLIVAVALTGVALAPVSLAAQQAQQVTHTVRKGDTLWDLAQQYLGDPFRWPEIYRLNTATVQNPHLIYPDQVLIISGEAAPTPGTPPDTAMAADTLAARMAGDTLAAAPDTMAVDEPVYVQQPMTIFNPARFRVVRGERQSLVLRSRAAAVRQGDYLRSPFLTAASGIAGAGRVDKAVSSDAVDATLSTRPVQPFDRLWVQLPEGASGRRDERFVIFRDGPLLEREGRVIVPTGVVKLITDGEGGRAQALLLTKYEDVYPGQRLMPLDTLALEPGVFPSRVEFGLATKVVWIYQDPVLPTVGQHVIFAAGSGDGLVPGDQVTVQRAMGVDANGVPLPAEDIAVAQVTRVTEQGTSAVVIALVDGGLKTGLDARVTAKMP